MIKIINPGMQSLIEDWPGRLGYLGSGMAPSGAMDNLALEMGNLLVGNKLTDAGIEICVGMFQAEFMGKGVIAITGADLKAKINGKEVPMWQSIRVSKGDIIQFGTYGQQGFRGYLSVAGGIDVPIYLGSRSTCLFGGYGGFEGRTLKAGDILNIGKPSKFLRSLTGRKIKANKIPVYSNQWELRLIPGMNAFPDYVSKEGMDYLYDHLFTYSINSNRSACRLDPLPDWFFSRKSGGDGGSHPSNIIDHAYNMRGAINVTGNTPALLIGDGPTLGGFMCCGNVINADLWKIGQGAPERDKIKFIYCTPEEAVEARIKQRALLTEESIEQ